MFFDLLKIVFFFVWVIPFIGMHLKDKLESLVFCLSQSNKVTLSVFSCK